MKTTVLFLLFFGLSFGTIAQCTDCSSLTEALKDPLRVAHLDLSNQGLTAVPAEVNQLIHLQTLDLSENLISELQLFAQFNELHYLNLNGNIGLDPWKLDQIGKAFPEIVRLELARCKLPLIPTGLDELPHLTILDLSGNDLVFLPEELEKLSQLSVLDLSDNQLSDVSYVLGTLWNLSRLDVSGNEHLQLTRVLRSVSLNSRLSYLAIDGDQLTRDGGKLLKSLPVETLELHALKDGLFPKELAGNKAISTLRITNSELTPAFGQELANMQQLSELTLDQCTVPSGLDKAVQLDRLIVKSNDPVPTDVLGQLSFLDRLDLIQTTLSPDQLEALTTELPQTTILSANATTTPEFVSNTVSPIAPLETATAQVSGSTPSTVAIADISFDIPANAFLSESGTPYSGDVSLAVKIYDNALDIALDGAPMTYTENGRTEVFSSAGMVDLKAFDAAGNPLSANPDNIIQMAMPNRLSEEQTDLFFYNPALNSWTKNTLEKNTLSYIDSVIGVRIDSINRLDLLHFVNYQSIPRLYSLRATKRRWDPSELVFRSYRAHRKVFANRNDRQQVLQYSMNHVGKLISSTHWKIDTLLTPELADALKTMRRCYQIPQHNHSRENEDYLSGPRIIRDLVIAPDFVNDHYRLQFLYKDSVVSLPVYIGSKGKRTAGNQAVMKAHARFQRQLSAAQHKDHKADEAGKRLRSSKAERFGSQNRAQMIVQVQQTLLRGVGRSVPIGRQVRNRVFIVPLVTFGLVNCDQFVRTIEPDYYQLEDILVDQNGKEYARPAVVRAVYNDLNSYIQVNSDAIPDYINTTTIVIIPLNREEIGVARLDGRPGKQVKHIESISIEGKSNAEIQLLIKG